MDKKRKGMPASFRDLAFSFLAFVPLSGAFFNAGLLSAQAAAPLPERASATVWVYAEQMPGNEPLSPRRELANIASFVLSGLVFGWRFEYVPPDSARGVQSYFSLEPLGEISPSSAGFSLSHIEERGIRLYCRAELVFGEDALNSARLWNSALFKSCRGRGYGDRSDETAGILEAYESSIRSAIHEHARKLEKNKPKEIRGEIKFKEEPRISALSGRFIADAEFLINVKEIVPYTVF